MKLVNKELIEKIPKLYSQENEEDPMVVAHFFNPCGQGDWWVIEGEQQSDRNWLFFGLVNLIYKELGYFSLMELESIQLPFGLKIERDLYWTPVKVSTLME